MINLRRAASCVAVAVIDLVEAVPLHVHHSLAERRSQAMVERGCRNVDQRRYQRLVRAGAIDAQPQCFSKAALFHRHTRPSVLQNRRGNLAQSRPAHALRRLCRHFVQQLFQLAPAFEFHE
jgi:hypothetical protein